MSRGGASLAPLVVPDPTWADGCSRARHSVHRGSVPSSPLGSAPVSPQSSVQGLCVSLSDRPSSPDMAGDEPGWETRDKAWYWAPSEGDIELVIDFDSPTSSPLSLPSTFNSDSTHTRRRRRSSSRPSSALLPALTYNSSLDEYETRPTSHRPSLSFIDLYTPSLEPPFPFAAVSDDEHDDTDVTPYRAAHRRAIRRKPSRRRSAPAPAPACDQMFADRGSETSFGWNGRGGLSLSSVDKKLRRAASVDSRRRGGAVVRSKTTATTSSEDESLAKWFRRRSSVVLTGIMGGMGGMGGGPEMARSSSLASGLTTTLQRRPSYPLSVPVSGPSSPLDSLPLRNTPTAAAVAAASAAGSIAEDDSLTIFFPRPLSITSAATPPSGTRSTRLAQDQTPRARGHARARADGGDHGGGGGGGRDGGGYHQRGGSEGARALTLDPVQDENLQAKLDSSPTLPPIELSSSPPLSASSYHHHHLNRVNVSSLSPVAHCPSTPSSPDGTPILSTPGSPRPVRLAGVALSSIFPLSAESAAASTKGESASLSLSFPDPPARTRDHTSSFRDIDEGNATGRTHTASAYCSINDPDSHQHQQRQQGKQQDAWPPLRIRPSPRRLSLQQPPRADSTSSLLFSEPQRRSLHHRQTQPHHPFTSTESHLHLSGASSRRGLASLDPGSESTRLSVRSMSLGDLHGHGGGDSSHLDFDTDVHRPLVQPAFPHPSHPFHHHKAAPSVPFSTRTTSTLSAPHHSHPQRDVSDAFSPPSSFSQLTNGGSGKRYSKFTAFSGSSSSSSLYSSDSSSLRWHGQYGSTVERPDISTVFEEEGSVDVDFTEPSENQRKPVDAGEEEAEKGTLSLQRDAINLTHAVRHQQQSSDYRHPHPIHLNLHSSSATLVPASSAPINRVRANRADTISSNHSTRSGKSNKSVHPFANVVVRPTSPPPSVPLQRDPSLLGASHQLISSKSQPNLADAYRMPTMAAQQVVSSEAVDEETCPVCVESLSFTFRLPGEKPPIVPECGHSLHEECFVTVYGDVPPEGSKKTLGVCGVCRQPMRIADREDRKARGNNKLAMLMGQGGQTSKPMIPHSHSTPSIRSGHGRGVMSPAGQQDPAADDPLENLSGAKSINGESHKKVVVPSISIRSEFPSVARGGARKGRQPLTAMITVEVPQAGDRGKYSGRPRMDMSRSSSGEQPLSPQFPPSPRSASSHPADFGATARSPSAAVPNSFAHVVNDLKHRVQDYRTSGLDSLGPLRLFDLLYVRKGPLVREFHVYLYQDALICISEEKKSGLKSLFSSNSSVRSNDTGSTSGRGVLKLKGRIYMKHVRKVIDSSAANELSLTITMIDESMDSFILVFKDRGSHETWKGNLNRLLEDTRPPNSAGNSASKVSKLMGNGAPTPTSNGRSANTLGMSFGDLTSPSTASGYSTTPATSGFAPTSPPAGSSSDDLTLIAPLAPVHTPIDLVIILSIPAPTPGAPALKVKLMRQALSFVCALMGSRDRLAFVACEMGPNGTVRKTPFLNPTHSESRKRLSSFIELLGTGKRHDDEYEAQIGGEERQDVVTAVNVALDVVLQRKAKNPLTGMILISDTSDIIKRAQMDLVAARLDAANVPVHALGYGKSHDPSPLWMISNHTNGTYTFVKEWYDLRDALAGVIGGLMSIALTNMKLHLSCAENDFKITKVSGATQAIVGTTGKEVDVELRELRHGEIREILVELELLSSENGSPRSSGEGSEDGPFILAQQEGTTRRSDPSFQGLRKQASFSDRSMSVNGLGMDTLSVSDANALQGVIYEDALIDEVPVTEVDCSFSDPAAGRSVARLAHPILLTTAILPPTAPPSSSPADPMIVRRRMELLASDMITRALLIASRKNFGHAARILKETKRIVETIADGLGGAGGQGQGNYGRSKREMQVSAAVQGLGATVMDLDMLLDGLEEHKEMFERDHRNYAAQQAVVLRSQKSWTTRTPSERQYCTKEVQQVVQISGEWAGRP